VFGTYGSSRFLSLSGDVISSFSFSPVLLATMPTVYLVSGANRGIGLGLVTALAAREDTVVYAGIRDHAKADALDALVTKYPGNVRIVSLLSTSEENNAAVASAIESEVGKVDVVFANAGRISCFLYASFSALIIMIFAEGIANHIGSPLDTPLDQVRAHVETNSLGPLLLFQKIYHLLKRSDAPSGPKFVVISSILGVIGDEIPIPATAYGKSMSYRLESLYI
jgi:NAD(P)-dependent dehydrogenase (short-subunit alcohol dehydrogenase family)